MPAPGFRVCGHCGVVDGVQNNPRGDTRHRGWCATRRGAAEEWEERLFLHHDLRTQAVRILLPVSMLDVESRMTSLAGAIMLGLREDFGGDPQHLDRLTVVQPGMSGTRRYLVLHDVVPGGTGYLDRIGDPERMKAILEHAQRVLRDCPCALDGLDACHRCLLGVVNSVEAGVVRRVTALALVTEILANWEVAPTETVTRTDMSGLAGSELEQRFRALLLAWAGGRARHLQRRGPAKPGRRGLLADAPSGAARGDLPGLPAHTDRRHPLSRGGRLPRRPHLPRKRRAQPDGGRRR